MGRTVLLGLFGLLALSQTLANEDKKVNSSVITDHESSESAPAPFHREAPVGVYASSRPHTSYSYKVYSSPQTASSKVVPKVLHHFDIRDSYGKFVQSNKNAAYKPSYPQQFVRLQDLPPHLAQPLVSAASPSFNFQAVPNYFFGPQSYKVPALQFSGPPGTLTQLGRFSEPLVYAPDINNLSPSTVVHLPASLTQFSNDLQETRNNNQYQQIYEKPKKKQHKSSKKGYRYSTHDIITNTPSHTLAKKLQQSAPTKIPAVVNGEKTVVKVETKPVLPLLDINLLEPLKFDNPLVPQLQHFLPKINSATYHKLPTFNPKKEQKDFVIHKVKTYNTDSDTMPKKKQNKPTKTGITVKGYPNSGDYSYEINTPNHKESYNEKVLKYNKETNSKPVEYSYNEQNNKEPEVYTFVHSSKEPLKVTHIEYSSDEQPKHLEYNNNLKTEDEEGEVKEDDDRPSSQESSENSEESSYESEEDGAAPQSEDTSRNQDHSYQSETPSHSYDKPKEHSETLREPIQHPVTYLLPTQEYQAKPVGNNPSQNHPPQQQFYIKNHPSSPPSHQSFQVISQNSNPYQNLQYEINQNGQNGGYAPTVPSHLLKVEHKSEQHNQQGKHEVVQNEQQFFSQPIIVHNAFQPISPHYEEAIRLVPTQNSHFQSIKVDPNQHIKVGPTAQSFRFNSSPTPQKLSSQQNHMPAFKPIPENTFQPHIYEKTRRVIIKEKEETPDEKHMHTEQIMAEMMDQEENSEEDFEKGYKDAAYGFPAYEQVTEDIEKDIYNPESYGVLKSDYKLDDSVFKDYQKEGDKFPKFARLKYNDAKNNDHEDYFLDFAVHQPESFSDRIKSKVNYYKMFKNNRPQGGKSEKLIFAPSFDFFSRAQKPKPFSQYKLTPKYEYEYPKTASKDSSSYASRPYHKYRTHFVEPQFQYGFEPISSPIAAESEMAAVATNYRPESETPGTRKKIYKEKFYLKKTTTRSKPS